MAKGRLEPTKLDDRQWKQLVEEAVALIPYYNPEWTDHNRTDLGITLIELFAWLVEGMIYRLNRVPERNFIEFLNLIGITRDPESPATTMLTFRLAPTASPLLLAKGHQVATPQTGSEPPVVFETDAIVQLLPINLATALNIRRIGPTEKYANISSALVTAPLSGASVTIAAGASITIALGFDQATTLPIGLRFAFRKVAALGELQVKFSYSQGGAPSAWQPVPTIADGTTNFTQNSIVTLTVPAGWAAESPPNWEGAAADSAADAVNQPFHWIGVVVENLLAKPYKLQLDSILFNSVHATSAITVTQPELLGTSDGSPFQVFSLKNVPLYETPGTPDRYAHAVVQVRAPLVGGAFGPWTTWTQTEEFPQGPGTFYRLNPVTGDVSFGNFDPVTSPGGHATIPPKESEIQALTYRYVAGGNRSNVPSSTITVLRTPASGLIGATNPKAAENGADEESIEDAKRRGPEVLRNRFRAVTAQDYEYLAREASIEVRKVRCLQPRQFTVYDKAIDPAVIVGDPWTYGALNRDTGNVHVIIIPGGPLSDPTPRPSIELLQEVADYLEERRAVAASLNVTGPRYLPLRVTADIKVWKKAVDAGLTPEPATNELRDETVKKIIQFLHPVLGNTDGHGWQVGEDQTIAPLFEFIKPSSEVGFISDLKITALDPLYVPPQRLYRLGEPSVWVKFADYEVVCSADSHDVFVDKI